MENSVFFGVMLGIILGLSTPQAQSCCIPDQLEGVATATLSSFSREGPRQAFAMSDVYFDNTNKRFAFYTNLTNSYGESYFQKTLELYSASGKHVCYQLDLKTRECKVCELSNLPLKFCIPDSAQKLAHFTLGAADESLPVSSYECKVPNTATQASITFLRNLCVPVSVLVIEDVDGAPSDVFMARFANIKLGISRPSVFDVPPECQSHTTLSADKTTEFLRLHFLTTPHPHL